MLFIYNTDFWFTLLAATILQIALSPDNLMVISLFAKKLPEESRGRAINYGMIIATVLKFAIMWGITLLVQKSSPVWVSLHTSWIYGDFDTKSLIFLGGGVFLMLNGMNSVSQKLRGVEEHTSISKRGFWKGVLIICMLNVLFSFDSTIAIVAITSSFPVILGSAICSLCFSLFFARRLCDFVARKPDFEVLGLCLLISIGFILCMNGAYQAHMSVFNKYYATNISQGMFILYILSVFFMGWIVDIAKTRRDNPVKLKRPFRNGHM